MDWTYYFFGYKGRINRGKFWFFVMPGQLIFMIPATLIALPYFLIEHPGPDDAGQPLSVLGMVTEALEVIVGFVYLIAYGAICVKRLHDRNKSAWWLAVFLGIPMALTELMPNGNFPDLIPENLQAPIAFLTIALLLWGQVELYFLRGTKGANRYGPDPLLEGG